MSFNVIKIQSEQPTPYDASHKILDFYIDEGAVYDLSKSRMNINVSCTTTSADPEAIFNTSVAIRDNTDNDRALSGVALVRNGQLSSAKMGNLETLRDVNLLRITEKGYTMDENEKIENSYNNLVVPKEEDLSTRSPFRVLKVVGDETISKSEEQSHDISIPLSDIFGVARSDVPLNTQRLGQVKVHAELNFDKLVDVNLTPQTDVVFTDTTNSKGYMEHHDSTVTTSMGTTTPFVSSRSYNDPSESPFWIGMAILISYKSGTTAGGQGGATGATLTTRITKIEMRSDGKLSITTAAGILIAANNSFFRPDAGPTFKPINPVTNTHVVNSVELVLSKYVNPPKNSDSPLEFTTYSTEHDHGNSVTHFNKQYSVEPNCDGVMVAYPVVPLSVMSSKSFTDFRIAIDNEDTTNRDVKRLSSLEYSRLYRFYGQNLKSLYQKMRENTNSSAAGVNASIQQNAIFETCDMTQNYKQFSLTTQGVAIDQIVLYKRLSRSV